MGPGVHNKKFHFNTVIVSQKTSMHNKNSEVIYTNIHIGNFTTRNEMLSMWFQILQFTILPNVRRLTKVIALILGLISMYLQTGSLTKLLRGYFWGLGYPNDARAPCW